MDIKMEYDEVEEMMSSEDYVSKLKFFLYKVVVCAILLFFLILEAAGEEDQVGGRR